MWHIQDTEIKTNVKPLRFAIYVLSHIHVMVNDVIHFLLVGTPPCPTHRLLFRNIEHSSLYNKRCVAICLHAKLFTSSRSIHTQPKHILIVISMFWSNIEPTRWNKWIQMCSLWVNMFAFPLSTRSHSCLSSVTFCCWRRRWWRMYALYIDDEQW